MTHGDEFGQWGSWSLLDLPDDMLFVILSFCDLQSLACLAQVCQSLARLVGQDCVWIRLKKRLPVVGDSRNINCSWSWTRSRTRQPVKEQCRISMNWGRGKLRDRHIIHHRVKQMPWLQFDERHLWASYQNVVKCYQQYKDGTLRELRHRTLRAHSDDVGRFVSKENLVVTGSRNGSICSFSADTGQRLMKLDRCHSSDINTIDFHNDTIVSGSRDATVKMWNMSATEQHLQSVISAEDRVWSVAFNPDGNSFAVGTAGINHVHPLRLWDTNSLQLLGDLGNGYRYGAGMLDIQYESPFILYSCGYDTLIRMWDLRKSFTNCVMEFEEPYDMTIYCVKTDGNNMLMAGTARYGMTRLWDKRTTQPVQMYYCGKMSSPVYSMAFDSSHLYVALDKGLHLLDFSAH